MMPSTTFDTLARPVLVHSAAFDALATPLLPEEVMYLNRVAFSSGLDISSNLL
jgi:hypothetical protein